MTIESIFLAMKPHVTTAATVGLFGIISGGFLGGLICGIVSKMTNDGKKAQLIGGIAGAVGGAVAVFFAGSVVPVAGNIVGAACGCICGAISGYKCAGLVHEALETKPKST